MLRRWQRRTRTGGRRLDESTLEDAKPPTWDPWHARLDPHPIESGGLTPIAGLDRTVWIFGCGRSGSTWLANMLNEFDRCRVWMEPGFGHIFARPEHDGAYLDSPSYALAGSPETRNPGIRAFISAAIEARYPLAASDSVMVLKDQNASVGAKVISDALPESRLLVLIRDPRDVVASITDAFYSTESWISEYGAEPPPRVSAAELAAGVVHLLTTSVQAYDSHAGPKVLLRYEDLRADPVDSMTMVNDLLDLGESPAGVRSAVSKLDWDGIPQEEKGSGKFMRTATPGGWRDTLSSEDAASIEAVAGSILDRFYPPTS